MINRLKNWNSNKIFYLSLLISFVGLLLVVNVCLIFITIFWIHNGLNVHSNHWAINLIDLKLSPINPNDTNPSELQNLLIVIICLGVIIVINELVIIFYLLQKHKKLSNQQQDNAN